MGVEGGRKVGWVLWIESPHQNAGYEAQMARGNRPCFLGEPTPFVIKPGLIVTRAIAGRQQAFIGWKSMTLYVGDVLHAAEGTSLLFEWAIGGRYGMGSGSTVRLNGQRDAVQLNATALTTLRKMWNVLPPESVLHQLEPGGIEG